MKRKDAARHTAISGGVAVVDDVVVHSDVGCPRHLRTDVWLDVVGAGAHGRLDARVDHQASVLKLGVQMRRREFISVIGCAVTIWPSWVSAIGSARRIVWASSTRQRPAAAGAGASAARMVSIAVMAAT
jgi:hypothetical protein